MTCRASWAGRQRGWQGARGALKGNWRSKTWVQGGARRGSEGLGGAGGEFCLRAGDAGTARLRGRRGRRGRWRGRQAARRGGRGQAGRQARGEARRAGGEAARQAATFVAGEDLTSQGRSRGFVVGMEQQPGFVEVEQIVRALRRHCVLSAREPVRRSKHRLATVRCRMQF